MQKLPEASDRKKGRRMYKEKGTSLQKGGSSFSFNSDRRIDNISISWLLVEANMAALRHHVGLTFH